ncbi:hypothetical protein [Methanolobus sp. WCC5]|jgi:hypothetical protein|uniref:hypothetical protein n=1 Tax=Methanolobus sp. WCC5 TaxID=3125785 RepID=UPI003249A612
MEKQNEVRLKVPGRHHTLPSRSNEQVKVLKNLHRDANAWVDLILSKTALIVASAIILVGLYNLAALHADIAKKDKLDALTFDIASGIDSVGSSPSGTAYAVKHYSFDAYSGLLMPEDYEKLNVSVTGEYVACTYQDKDHKINSARSLSYRTLPFSPSELEDLLSIEFGDDGTIVQPIHSLPPYTDVTGFLALASAEERHLYIKEEILIEKVSIFVTEAGEVRELEYVLVYQ